MPLPPPLLHITEQNHDVLIDLMYATENNFTGQVIYEHPLCFLHPQAENRLRQAIAAARTLFGLRIKILDAFRPQEAQEALWAFAPNPDYVADPAKGSNHTRDAHGQALDMGTPVDTMTPASHHFHAAHPAAVQLNRMKLLTVMLEAGFVHHPHEWWHYQLPDAARFPLIDSHAFMRCVPTGHHPASV